MEEAFEEGQGSCRAVKPMMMMTELTMAKNLEWTVCLINLMPT
jgi:hypothetical protein